MGSSGILCSCLPANLLSIGAIDFGILIDGTIVMVEDIYRELSLRHGQEYTMAPSTAEPLPPVGSSTRRLLRLPSSSYT